MGKRGPKPTPTKILDMRGSWRAKVREGEPQPVAKIPSCPSWVSCEGKREWRRLVKELGKLNLLTELDRTLLALHCQAYDDYINAKKLLDKSRIVIQTINGNRIQNPVVGAMNKAYERLMKTAQEFGLSPSSRTKIRTSEPQEDEKDDNRFFRNRSTG